MIHLTNLSISVNTGWVQYWKEVIPVTGWFDANAFGQEGFFVVEQYPDGIRVVKGHCEIHVQKVPEGVALDVPVMALRGKKAPSEALMSYLLERNGAMNGPGFFAMKEGCIYYRAIAYCHESIEKLALHMQITIEKLGPKIVNVAKQ